MNPPCIAVSGLHRGENPQPGPGIIRSIRRVHPHAYIIGLAYDVMESGIYVEDGPDEVQLMPYPATGAAAFFQRLDALHQRHPIDLFIPTLDSEIEILVHLKKDLDARGIRVCLPDARTLRRRAKQFLPALADTCGIAIPDTRIAHDAFYAHEAALQLGFPLIIKGAFYDATLVSHLAHAQATAAHLLAEWGAPVILQHCVSGPEFDVLGIGDGRGGIVAQCSMRKTILSDKGKGLGGITVRDARLDHACAKLIGELRWNGPFEIEWIRDPERGEYVLIEINPRFPAWIDFPAMLGANFAAALVERMLHGEPCRPITACPAGSFFLRHQIEVAGDIRRYAELLRDDAGHGESFSERSITPLQPVTETL